MGKLFRNIIRLLEKLSSKPRVDGLEVTDAALTYVYLDNDVPKTAAVRLAPGILRSGKLEDKAAFIEALKTLHNAVLPDAAEKPLKIDCVLPSSAVYTQSFEVPNVGEDKLAETVGLNLQMISPIAVVEANMSAQVIGETPDRYELLGAFADQGIVASFKEAFAAAHFTPVAFEFPSLALARLIARSVKVEARPTLVLHLKSDGLDLAIIRDGNLHFAYFRSWQSIQGDARTIPRELFDAVLVEEVRKVINFSVSRWGEGPAGALLIAPNFEKEVAELLAANFDLKSAPFSLPEIGLSPNFYVALGAAVRSLTVRVAAEPFRSINVGGEGLARMMSEDQVLDFIGLWRNILAGVLAVVLLAFILSASFLVQQASSLTGQVNAFRPTVDQKTLADLVAKANDFNLLVRGVSAAKSGAIPWYAILNHLISIADQDRVVLSDVSIESFTAPVQVAASAPDYATVLQFKNALVADPAFGNVDLPLTQVTTLGNNTVSFNVSFNFTSAAMDLR